MSLKGFVLGDEEGVYTELADRLVVDGSNNLKNVKAILTGTYHQTAAVTRVETELIQIYPLQTFGTPIWLRPGGGAPVFGDGLTRLLGNAILYL